MPPIQMEAFMKKWIAVLTLLAAGTALAEPRLPDHLTCTSQAVYKEVQRFEIRHINSESLETSIYDASTADMDSNGSVTNFSFSNECDNSFDMVFFTQNLWQLTDKSATSVRGLIYYSTPEISDEFQETIAVDCTL
jgi:hypothetical protein